MVSLLVHLFCHSTSRSLHCAFRQDHTGDNALVLDTLGLTWALEERHLQDELLRLALDGVEDGLQIGVPTGLEAVVPATVHRISGLELEVRLTLISPEARCRDVSDIVDKVGVHRAHGEREAHLLQGRRGRVEVLRLLESDTAEVVLELRGTVGEPVTLLSRNVAAPMADFDIPLKKRGMCEGLGELVANADFLLSARGQLAVWSVSESIALLLRILLTLRVELSRKNSSVRDIGRRELELGLLLEGCVCARRVGGELVQDVLLVVLLDLGGERLEGREEEVGDREGELLFGGER